MHTLQTLLTQHDLKHLHHLKIVRTILSFPWDFIGPLSCFFVYWAPFLCYLLLLMYNHSFWCCSIYWHCFHAQLPHGSFVLLDESCCDNELKIDDALADDADPGSSLADEEGQNRYYEPDAHDEEGHVVESCVEPAYKSDANEAAHGFADSVVLPSCQGPSKRGAFPCHEGKLRLCPRSCQFMAGSWLASLLCHKAIGHVRLPRLPTRDPPLDRADTCLAHHWPAHNQNHTPQSCE